jgi:hypothetical protein
MEDEQVDHAPVYGNMAGRLTGIEEIWLDNESALCMLPWLACSENRFAFGKLRSLKVTHDSTPGADQDGDLATSLVKLRAKSQIELSVVNPGPITRQTLDIMKAKGARVDMVDADVFNTNVLYCTADEFNRQAELERL